MKAGLFATLIGTLLGTLICPITHAQTSDSWTNRDRSTTLKWETGLNWSKGVPPMGDASVQITNNVSGTSFSRIINIDATTVSSAPNSLTMTNLVISIPSALNRTKLMLNNTGSAALTVLSVLAISNRCSISVSNSTLQVKTLNIFGIIYDDGAIVLDSGTINTAHAEIGYMGHGSWTVNGGTWAGGSSVGDLPGSSGTLTIAGGNVIGNIEIGLFAESTGSVWLTGGSLNGDISTYGGVGQMTVSNGTIISSTITIADQGIGTLTFIDGTATVSSQLIVGGQNSTGVVWMTGGQLVIGNTIIDGMATISNGLWQSGSFTVGEADCLSAGAVFVAGGTLCVTNAAHNSTLVLNGGELNVTAGSLITDETVLTNSCTVGLLVSGSGSVWSNGDNLLIGGMAAIGDSLVITNGGVLVNNHNAILGWTAANPNNSAVVVGPGSVWSNGFALSVGEYSAGNSLTISGGGVVVTTYAFLGNNGVGATNNTVVVTDGGSAWDNFVMDVGFNGGNSSLVISNGGVVSSTFATVGVSPGCNNNRVVVTGSGSSWNSTSVVIGNSGNGNNVTVSSGGVLVTTNIVAGELAGGQGTFTVATGGTATIVSNLTLGNFSCTGTGVVVVAGGNLSVTNASATGVLEVRSGTFVLSSGTVVVDRFVMTNACAHFVRTGGTLIYGSAILSQNLDADGDGIPNGYELAHNLDPLQPADASLDNDGDGFSNLLEYQAGTDPNNSGSIPFHIATPVLQGNDVLIIWTTIGGKTNVVQAAQSNSSYSNSFTDISPIIVPGGTSMITTNYLDTGGATNIPARYYRVRLVP